MEYHRQKIQYQNNPARAEVACACYYAVTGGGGWGRAEVAPFSAFTIFLNHRHNLIKEAEKVTAVYQPESCLQRATTKNSTYTPDNKLKSKAFGITLESYMYEVSMVVNVGLRGIFLNRVREKFTTKKIIIPFTIL